MLDCTVAAVLTCTALINGFIRDEARADATRYLQAYADALRDALDTGMAQHFEEVRVIARLDTLANGGDTAATRRMLKQVRASFPQFAWLGLTDMKGRVMASVGGLLEGQHVSARPWLAGARDTAYVGDVHRALLLEKLLPAQSGPWQFVDVATPVRGADGKLAGVLGAHLSWGWAAGIKRQIVDRALAQENAEAFVLSANGTVLVGTPQTEGKPLAAGPAGELRVTSLGASVQHASAGSGSTGNYPGLGWQVMLRQPQAVAMAMAMAAFYDLQKRTLVAAALLCALAAPPLWWLARTLSRPLRELTVRLDGDATSTAPVNPLNREAQLLGNTLDRHARRQADDAARWRELNATPEARVAQRTEALEQANGGLQSAIDERQCSELRLRDITDNVPALIAYFDLDERCSFANAQARRVHGLAPADVSQTTLRSALGKRRYAQYGEHIDRVKRGQPTSFEGQLQIGKGRVDFRTHFVPDANAQGRMLGFYVLSNDHTALENR